MADKVKKDRSMRMIWNGNAVFAPSGYGVFLRELLYRLVDDKWPVAQIAYYGLEGGMLTVNGLPIYPKIGDQWGTDAMILHSKHFKADVVFSMQDVWPMNPNHLKQIPKWIPYVPIDHSPVPPLVLDKLKYAYKIITFSEFGQKELEKSGFTSTLIVEGTDTNQFKPMDKKEIRKQFNVPEDVFLFGMVGANKDNPPRKGFQVAMESFAKFVKKHPKSGLFLHTLINMQGGFPIVNFAKYLGIEKNIFYIDHYNAMFHSDHKVISKEMNMFDCLLQPSHNEGFGLPIIEAQSCGVPVIVTDFTAMPELIIEGKTGELCKVKRTRWTPLQSYVAVPDDDSLYEKMEIVFEKLNKPNTMAKDCRDHIVENYNIDKLFVDKWVPFMEDLQKELQIDKKQEK